MRNKAKIVLGTVTLFSAMVLTTTVANAEDTVINGSSSSITTSNVDNTVNISVSKVKENNSQVSSSADTTIIQEKTDSVGSANKEFSEKQGSSDSSISDSISESISSDSSSDSKGKVNTSESPIQAEKISDSSLQIQEKSTITWNSADSLASIDSNFLKESKVATNNYGWHESYGTWYYLKPDGTKVTKKDAHSNGWVYIGGTPYIFDDWGELKTDTRKDVNGKWYYLDKKGHYIKNQWYNNSYYKADGSAVTSDDAHSNGWVYIGGAPYVFDINGYLWTDIRTEVNGKWYYLDKDGHYVRNKWVGSYYYGQDGVSSV